jgi:hypothetical protein
MVLIVGASGGVVSTLKVLLGPAAGALLPALSVADPALMEIPMVPLPLIEVRETVHLGAAQLTLFVAVGLSVAPPVVLRVTFSSTRVIVSAPA